MENNMNKTDKDLVWLPVPLCEKIKQIQDTTSAECQKLVEDYIQQAKNEYKESLSALDEDVLMFRGLMVQAKNSFKAAKDEQLSSHYEIWEKFENDLPKLHEMVDKMVKELEPLKTTLDKINAGINQINTWEIKHLLEIVQTVSNIVGSKTNSSDIIKFLFNEYKKDPSAG